MAGRPLTRGIQNIGADPTAVGVKLLAELAATVSPSEIAETVKGLLSATMIQRMNGHDYEERPDWRARESGVKLYLGYLLGLPVQRTLEIHQTLPPDDSATMERLLSSPAVRAALRRELDMPAAPGGSKMTSGSVTIEEA